MIPERRCWDPRVGASRGALLPSYGGAAPLPCLTLPCRVSPCLALSCFTLPHHRVLPCLRTWRGDRPADERFTVATPPRQREREREMRGPFLALGCWDDAGSTRVCLPGRRVRSLAHKEFAPFISPEDRLELEIIK